MRLIDADDAINVLTNRLFEMLKTQIPCVTATENQVCLDTCYKIAKYEIDNIPTAYDVDKVVKQLDKESQLIKPVGWTYRYEVILTRSVLEIVKAGGIDDLHN